MAPLFAESAAEGRFGDSGRRAVAPPGLVRVRRLRQAPTGEAIGIPRRAAQGSMIPRRGHAPLGSVLNAEKTSGWSWTLYKSSSTRRSFLVTPARRSRFPQLKRPTSDVKLGASARTCCDYGCVEASAPFLGRRPVNERLYSGSKDKSRGKAQEGPGDEFRAADVDGLEPPDAVVRRR